jgi:hypothetical protein
LVVLFGVSQFKGHLGFLHAQQLSKGDRPQKASFEELTASTIEIGRDDNLL